MDRFVRFVIVIILLSISSSGFTQQRREYQPDWDKVKKLQDSGLVKSALKEVSAIYETAKKDKNDPQIIRSLIYTNYLSTDLEENDVVQSIERIENELISATATAKSILLSIDAQLYQQYLAYNRYRLYSAGITEGFPNKDISTWSIDDLQNRIRTLYTESLMDKSTQTVALTEFSDIIINGNADFLRPTLFDLLAHRALSYFMSQENAINRPAYAYEITEEEAFSPASDFINYQFRSEDTASLHLEALKIFQELMRLHIHEIKALVDVDLERLGFVKSNSVSPGKEEFYLNAVKDIYLNTDDPSAAGAGFLWADQVYQLASKDPAKKSEYSAADAVEILQQVIGKYPLETGGIQAANLLSDIKHPTLSVQTEKVNLPQNPFRALISYSNSDKIYLRIVNVTQEQKRKIRNEKSDKGRFEMMTRLPATRQWQQNLIATDDYLSRDVEIKIDGLPVGEYMLLASKDQNFKAGSKNLIAANFFYVSNISYVSSDKDYFVLNRETGSPIAGAAVKVMRQSYNASTRTYEYILQTTLKTDKKGHINIPRDPLLNNITTRLDITTPNDHLYLEDGNTLYYYDGNLSEPSTQEEMDKKNARIFFFTDRSIYRPGQTIYYKGIGVTKGLVEKKSQLLESGKNFQVLLQNANFEVIDSARVHLNEYGSFSGSFMLPEGGLNGNFRLIVKDISGSAAFSVEEYKRPKFYTELQKDDQTSRINDTIHITGKAEAYTGNAIDGASVSYRVIRKARFIHPWYFWRIGIPDIAPLEIVHGETITDKNGTYKIDFVAVPDLKIDPETDPVFDYEISVDVTDINGETRSSSATVPVGYKLLNLQIGLSDKQVFLANQLKSIPVSLQNLSSTPQKGTVNLTIFQLQEDRTPYRTRLWAQPNAFVISEAEFKKIFPNDPYRDEDKPESWKSLSVAFNYTDTVNGDKNIQLNRPLKSGWYKVEVSTTDRLSKEIKDIRYFQILDPKKKKNAASGYFKAIVSKNSFQPGENAVIYFSSSTDIRLFRQIMRDGKTKESSDVELIDLNNQTKTQELPVTEEERGGLAINYFFVKDNRFYTTQTVVPVPWDNKKLQIQFESFRDKTLPGSKEDWSLKIIGDKGQKVASELLISMYDVSLNQFRSHNWSFAGLWPDFYYGNRWSATQNFVSVGSMDYSQPPKQLSLKSISYPRLGVKGIPENYYSPIMPGPYPVMKKSGVFYGNNMMVARESLAATGSPQNDVALEESATENTTAGQEQSKNPEMQVRTNFNETAFFYPDLKTDSSGNVSFSFTTPEALTRWRMMVQAHTADLSTGYAEKSIVTQKDLMIIPNPPRFLREGDQLVFSAKVVNMSDSDLNVSTVFHLLNATTNLSVDKWFKNDSMNHLLEVPARQSRPVFFTIEVPVGFNDMVAYRITAQAENMSDGEEAYLPVLTNRMLVTESFPLEMNQTGMREFSFEKLLRSGGSNTLTNQGITVEYTTNPAWYAVQALPYLNEYPYESAEQALNRYFSNALAMHIANSTPQLQKVFDGWKEQDTSVLLSNLQKNQDLKSILLEETPWVLAAKNEAQQKKNIALLFDLNKMTGQLSEALKKVEERQLSNGGFSWETGGADNRFMTQYIIAAIGHLKYLGATPDKSKNQLEAMTASGIQYIDNRIKEDFEKLKERKAVLKNNQLTYIAAHYLYTRSFFPEIKIRQESLEAYQYYLDQAKKYWAGESLYTQGLIALALNRAGEKKVAIQITKSLKERSIVNEKLGMYWKAMIQPGWWWYQAPIESQALMVEVFSEITNDIKSVNLLKTWLLKNKQTNNWKTTKATAEAVYALLIQGAGWLSSDQSVSIQLGKTTIDNKNEIQEAGTGYFSRMLDGNVVRPAMGNITVTVTPTENNTGKNPPSWGAVYWQYFEDIDKITSAETPLQLSKKLFIEKNTDRGPVLTPVSENESIKTGSKLIVRIELRVDRDMEYVHMKDMRASATEPIQVISQYKWQNSLGYYESTKDASTNFFFSYLRPGTYIFEYPLFVTHDGNFSTGITTISSLYAPEFSAHSEGSRIVVRE